MLLRRLLDGETVTHDGPVYPMKDALVAPRPVQARLPIMIGGSAARRRRSGRWPGTATSGTRWARSEKLAERDAILREHCAAIGRDQARDRAHDHGRHRHPRHARGRDGLPTRAGWRPRRGVRRDLELLRRDAGRDRRGPAAARWSSGSGTSSSTRRRPTTSRRSTGSARSSSCSTRDRRSGASSRSPAGSAARSWPRGSRPTWATGSPSSSTPATTACATACS